MGCNQGFTCLRDKCSMIDWMSATRQVSSLSVRVDTVEQHDLRLVALFDSLTERQAHVDRLLESIDSRQVEGSRV